MKKILLPFVFLLINTAIFAQGGNTEVVKKENMGQSISDVNAYYKDQVKAVNADGSLSKAEKKARRKELKNMKNDRIHDINSGAINNKVKDKDKEMKDKDGKMDGKKEKKEKKEKEMKDHDHDADVDHDKIEKKDGKEMKDKKDMMEEKEMKEKKDMKEAKGKKEVKSKKGKN